MIFDTARMRSKQNTSIIAMIYAFNKNRDMRLTYHFMLTTFNFQTAIALIAHVYGPQPHTSSLS